MHVHRGLLSRTNSGDADLTTLLSAAIGAAIDEGGQDAEVHAPAVDGGATATPTATAVPAVDAESTAVAYPISSGDAPTPVVNAYKPGDGAAGEMRHVVDRESCVASRASHVSMALEKYIVMLHFPWC